MAEILVSVDFMEEIGEPVRVESGTSVRTILEDAGQEPSRIGEIKMGDTMLTLDTPLTTSGILEIGLKSAKANLA